MIEMIMNLVGHRDTNINELLPEGISFSFCTIKLNLFIKPKLQFYFTQCKTMRHMYFSF